MTTVTEPLADAHDMFAAHTMFRREFGLMPGLVRAVEAGDKQRSALVADHVAMVTSVLNHHHSGEDAYVWPRLRERCPEECTSLVDVMEDQHHAIHAGLLQVAQAAEAWRDSASAEARHSLAGAIERLLPVMNDHLAVEEERVVPLIEKYVTQAEYARVAQEQGAEVPPDKLPAVFGMFMYEADPAAIDLAIAEMPPEVQPVIRDLAPKAYAAYAEELYGTPNPPRVMSIPLSQPDPSLNSAIGGGLHVPARAGVTKWFFGDTYSIKLTSQLTNGSLGLIEASVPPGGGPVAHTHAHEDEIWYLISGELEFLSGDQTFDAGPGDVVFIPRTVRHRFRNVGVGHVKMLFLFTPGGPENIFIEGGDEPKPGQSAQLWGPERLEKLADLMVTYGVEALPEA